MNWQQVVKEITPRFLTKINGFDKDSVTYEVLQTLKAYMNKYNLQSAHVEEVSVAAYYIYEWVKAVELYATLNHNLEPKKLELSRLKEKVFM